MSSGRGNGSDPPRQAKLGTPTSMAVVGALAILARVVPVLLGSAALADIAVAGFLAILLVGGGGVFLVQSDRARMPR